MYRYSYIFFKGETSNAMNTNYHDIWLEDLKQAVESAV